MPSDKVKWVVNGAQAAAMDSTLSYYIPNTYKAFKPAMRPFPKDGNNQEFFSNLPPYLRNLYNMSYNRKPKAFHHKARTGCITCKRRRVKCDETKPTCLRCKSGGYLCDGYQPLDAKVFETSSQATMPSMNQLPSNDFVDLAKLLSDSFPDQSLEEKRALAYFRERTAPTLAAFARASEPFWLYTAGQYAHAEKAVFHTIIALATRHEINQSDQPVQPATVKLCETSYSAALKTLVQQGHNVKDAQAQRNHEDRVLQCCALLVAYEIIHDPTARSDVGLTHILSGIKILEQRNSASAAEGLKSPMPYGIASASNEMMFSQLGLIVPMFALPLQATDIILPEHGLWARPQIPRHFNDLDEAKRSFFDICRWYWQCAALEKSASSSLNMQPFHAGTAQVGNPPQMFSNDTGFTDVVDLLQAWWVVFQPFTKMSNVSASVSGSNSSDEEDEEGEDAAAPAPALITPPFPQMRKPSQTPAAPILVPRLSSADKQRAACFWTQFYLLSIAFKVSASSIFSSAPQSSTSSRTATASYDPGMRTLSVDLSDRSQRTITSTYLITSPLLKKTLMERHQRGTPTIHAGMDWLWPVTDVLDWDSSEYNQGENAACIMRSVMNRM